MTCILHFRRRGSSDLESVPFTDNIPCKTPNSYDTPEMQANQTFATEMHRQYDWWQIQGTFHPIEKGAKNEVVIFDSQNPETYSSPI